MPFNWKDITQQQLSGLPALQQQGNTLAPLQNTLPQPLRTGNNPNPKFPRARNAWENIKDKLGNVAAGGVGGAAGGAALGSIVPGIGTGLGAALGALGGSLYGGLSDKGKEFTFGTPEEIQQVQNYGPEQQNIFRLLQQLGIYGLQNPYAGFEPIEQQARNQFNQQTIPGLAERFASLGNNALSSGAFYSQLGQAGAGLEADLAAQKAQYGQQNIGQILQMLQLGLQPQFENIHRPQSNGLFQNTLLSGIQAAPKIYQARQIDNLIKELSANKG
jgi:hypothetical protein